MGGVKLYAGCSTFSSVGTSPKRDPAAFFLLGPLLDSLLARAPGWLGQIGRSFEPRDFPT